MRRINAFAVAASLSVTIAVSLTLVLGAWATRVPGTSAEPIGTATPTATAPPSALPDLIVQSITDAQQGAPCTTPAGVNVVVANIGSASADPSTTLVSATTGGSQYLITPLLAPGASVTLHSSVAGIPIGDRYAATADVFNVVAETSETDNSLSVVLALGTLPTCTPSPTATLTPISADTPTFTPTYTHTATSGLPDLVVQAMSITLQTGDSCDYNSTTLGIAVVAANIGTGPAGAFLVDVNGARQTVDGLAAGQTTSLWFSGYLWPGANTATVDVTNLVPESDEGNNQINAIVAIPTLPPTCTPTGVPTPIPTFTPTPSVDCVADVNGDGAINVLDLVRVARHMGSRAGGARYDPQLDLDDDGDIDVRDLLIVLNQFGTCP